MPLGRKAAQTRKTLLEAAGRLFAADGYATTSVGDIAAEAGVSLGTFYQYFRDRGDIIAALAGHAALVMLAHADEVWRLEEGRAGVRSALGPYVAMYAATAPFQAVWEEVTHVEERLATLRKELTGAITAAIEDVIERGVEEGLLRKDLDPEGAALALGAMVDRTCYLRFVVERPRSRARRVEETTELLTDLWVHATGLED